MSTRSKKAGTGTESRQSKADPQWVGKTIVGDMEFAIDMLKVRLQSTTSLSEKVRLYNQIKTLRDDISRPRSEE
jgi:hypothetical protein